ncbi:MAG: anthranilate phosphoribosyltransferase [Bacteroidetes bacterium 4572_117]|nr:MAG: anthranilate phosphoribosyltransferase [Bacteroidetes bacterium 4572_117]
MKEILDQLFEHQALSYAQAKEILINIGQGKYNQSQIAAFLTVYLMRSITIDELAGFRDALLDLCIKVDLSDYNTIDLCGTGGDGKDTFNISTLTSFVVAGAGYKVSKHGNYGVSSGVGSSNVLEYLGYKFTNDQSKIKKAIDKAGICFLHAPLFHPAMKNVGPIRKELKAKTFFNILGPMVNPSFPQNQMVGVYSLEVARLYAYLYQKSDKYFAIIHNLDGYDEVSLTTDFKRVTQSNDEILSPGYFGFQKISAQQIASGGTVKKAAKIFVDILEGNGTEAQKNVVLANAALAIQIMNKKTIDESLEEAKESIKSGKAHKSLSSLIKI